MKLGRLQKLDLRTYWKREATEFTPWLAQEENIQLLGDTIGVELEVVGQEESVGPFSADILCKDTLNDHFVLIENQLERTDHTHLGQLLTYAAGLDAVTIVWIAQQFTEEHRATLDWLNRITDDQFTFFGIEIELYRIGDSAPAPMFNIISKPNDWSKQVKRSTKTQHITDTKILQQEYWQKLKDYMESNKSFVKMQNAQPQHWASIAIGRSHFSLSALVNSRDNSISINLNITGDDAKQNYDKLYNTAYNGSLAEVSNEIFWDKLEGRKMSIVSLRTSGNFTNKNDWDNQFQWFKENLEKFTTYFKPIISKI